MLGSINTYLELISLVQFLLVTFIIFRLSIGKKTMVGREWLLWAFALYWVHLLFFWGELEMRESLVPLINPDILGVLHHLFFTLFFIAFGYGLVGVIVTQPLLRRIYRHSTYLIVFVIILISLAIVLSDVIGLRFSHTDKEFIYEGLQGTINLLIIVVLYNSWKDTGSRRLFLDSVAFSIFFLGNVGHILTLIATHALPLHLEFTLMRYIFSTFALFILGFLPIRPSPALNSVSRSTPEY